MVAHFLTAAGKDTYALVKTLVFPQKPTDKSYNELKQAPLQHLLPTNFQATERAAFHSLVRASNESIRNFILKFIKQAARCDFCDRNTTTFKSVRFIVIPKGPSVIGLRGIQQLPMSFSLAAQTVDSNTSNTIPELIVKCSTNKGGMKVSHIHLQVNGDPVFLKRRVVPYGLREPVKKEIDNLVSDGIIFPVEQSHWATPIVTPLKSSGQPRVCGDFRMTINPKLQLRGTTTEEPEDVLHYLQGAKYFSKIDLRNAFLQLPLAESSKPYTTINTPFGLFQYNFLPFGLSISPEIFQSIINSVLQDLLGVKAYQDDIIVYGDSKSTRDLCLLKLLQRLYDRNVTINPNKFLEFRNFRSWAT